MLVTLLASHTIDPLKPFLVEALAKADMPADVSVGPFNSVAQELLNPASETLAARPDVLVVSQVLEDVSPLLATSYATLSEADIRREIDTVVTAVRSLLAAARKTFDGTIIVHNFAPPLRRAFGRFDNMAPLPQIDAQRALNAALTKAVRAVPSAYVLDVDRLVGEMGQKRWVDERYWFLAHSPFSAEALRTLAAAEADLILATRRPRRKALVLDLDNTLWGGVLGEDGLGGIKLGQTFPGNIFREFQQSLLQLRARGVMLAVNSKNNPAEVDEVFAHHPEMLLKRDHFAAVFANWEDKAENMRKIAAELNIGVDSLAFFDDSPVERERLKGALPEVLTIEPAGGPETFAAAILESRAFDQLTFTEEDRRRGQLVEDETSRRAAATSAASLEDFLRSLDMQIAVRPVTDFSFPRMLELHQKTNQFNLTTRRYTEKELADLRAKPGAGLFTLEVKDRFGDLGIVGAAVVLVDGRTAQIDSLLMSCRVIGRTVETAFLRELLDWARSKGAGVVEGEFRPTEKNAPAKSFYADHKFRAAGGGMWTLDLGTLPFDRPGYIRMMT